MIRLILRREKPEAEWTFGTLLNRGMFIAHTMEPGDKDTDHPRVDPGFYALEPHGWEIGAGLKFTQTWALVGEGVSHQPDGSEPRSAVLLHQGNTDEDTHGCILVGLKRGDIDGRPAILNSKLAMIRLRELIGGPKYAGLTIIGG